MQFMSFLGLSKQLGPSVLIWTKRRHWPRLKEPLPQGKCAFAYPVSPEPRSAVLLPQHYALVNQLGHHVFFLQWISALVSPASESARMKKRHHWERLEVPEVMKWTRGYEIPFDKHEMASVVYPSEPGFLWRPEGETEHTAKLVNSLGHLKIGWLKINNDSFKTIIYVLMKSTMNQHVRRGYEIQVHCIITLLYR